MNRLRMLRTEKKLSIRELGDKTSISYPTISNMENEIRPFTQANLEILCDFFNVSSDYILGKSEIRNPRIAASSKEALKGIKLALYNQTDELTDDQAKDVLQFIEFLKSKGK